MISENEASNLLAEAQLLRQQILELKNQKASLELHHKRMLNELYERIDSIDAWSTFIHDLADLPGTREPKWYRVSIPFEYGDRQERFSQVQISPSGPFVCTQMQAYYKNLDADESHYPAEYDLASVTNIAEFYPITPNVFSYNSEGRLIAPTSFFGTFSKMLKEVVSGPFNETFNGVFGGVFSSYDSATVDYTGLARGDGWNYPEFDLRIQTASNNSFWTGTEAIPMASVFGGFEPLYISKPSIVKATDSLVVFAKPTTPSINLKGSVEFVFHGYQINAHLDLEQLGV